MRLGCLCLALLVLGCPPEPKNPRAPARSVIVAVAHGVQIADVTCARVALARMDEALARDCDQARDEAVEALLFAESALDAGSSEDVPCAVAHAVTGLRRLMGLVEKYDETLPPAVHDALFLAPILAGACVG